MSEKLSVSEQILVETIQKASAIGGELYDGAKKVTASSIDFAEKQIPEVIQQVLVYNLIESILFAVVGLLLAGGFIKTFLWLRKEYIEKRKKSDWADETGHIMFGIFGGIFLGGGGILCFLANTLIALKIIFAPKLYLLEYAAKLIKG